MSAIEMKMSLLQEVMSLDDNEQLIKKALASLRRLKEKARVKEMEADDYVEPTKEEILAGIKEALLEVRAAKEGKVKLQDAREWLNGL